VTPNLSPTHPPTLARPTNPARVDAHALDALKIAADLRTGDPAILARNLAALERASPDAAARIRAAPERSDAAFTPTDDNVSSCSITDISAQGASSARQLASRRRPLDEARALTAPLNPADTGVFVVAGFALGYHVRELCRKVGRAGVIVVFEPDVALLRSVLSRIDHSVWLSSCNICILTDPENATAMMQSMRGVEGLVGLGVRLLEHPPSTLRLGPSTAAFHERFVSVIEAVKMTVVTSLVQTQVTFRNLLQNADAYAKWPGIAELEGLLNGRPAIVVSAGPSLARNIALLKDPSVRERCVIVAVQTVLKPLLAQGIKPHFVTALDYSEISKRFYEGLSESDVDGITLVAEAKVNPGVLQAWPGKVRIITDRILDSALGPAFARSRGTLRAGATVAHLAYYLARFLGCEPVALIGQDLGFTDGQYYAAGAAIHNTWAPELNEFNTLEMLEHQRIMRMGAHLRRAQDTLGRPIYTDEQMLAYLRQFEEDFKLDEAKGLRTIDCTEGGVRKEHTETSTLHEFLQRFASDTNVPPICIPAADPVANASSLAKKLPDRLIELQRQASEIAAASAKAGTLLTELLEHHLDRPRADGILAQIERLSKTVHEHDPAFTLVQHLGQTMVFNRLKADRLISLAADLDEAEIQKRRTERDIANVAATRTTAQLFGRLVTDALQSLRSGRKQTRDLPHDELLAEIHGRKNTDQPTRTEQGRTTVVALIPVDLHRSGLDTPRSLERPFNGAPNLLCATLRRLARCTGISAVVLATDQADECRRLVSADASLASLSINYVALPPNQILPRRKAVAAARRWSSACWRGGVANLSIYDELFEPLTLSRVLSEVNADAALLAGPDWCLVDPALCDRVIDRYRENPSGQRMTFTQAPPGLAGCVVSAQIAQDMSASAGRARAAASVGGVMSYHPTQPIADLLGHRVHVTIEPAIRDNTERWIIDDDRTLERLNTVTAAAGPDADALRLVTTHRALTNTSTDTPLIRELVLDARALDTRSNTTLLAPATLQAFLRQAWEHNPALALTFRLNITAPASLASLISAARLAGLTAVHAEISAASLSSGTHSDWLALELDILSVRIDPRTPASLDAALALATARSQRRLNDDFQTPWIVPRLTRSDDSYPLVEQFVTHSINAAAWCTLDPMDATMSNTSTPAASAPPSERRITALPIPIAARERLNRSRLIVLADGRALIDPTARTLEPALPITSAPLADLWRQIQHARTHATPTTSVTRAEPKS
jgi:hypothetical protein